MKLTNLGFITINLDSLCSINLIGSRIYFMMNSENSSTSIHFDNADNALNAFKIINKILGLDYHEELVNDLYKSFGEICQDSIKL